MPLRPADLVHRPVGDREVDLVGRSACLLRTEAQTPEQGLGHAVMTLVLLEGAVAPIREPALPAEARDQPKFFERAEVGEGRRRSHSES